MLKNAKRYIEEELHIEVLHGNINSSWFAEQGLPMVVECSCCQTTMVLFSAFVDDNTQEVYCSCCAGID